MKRLLLAALVLGALMAPIAGARTADGSASYSDELNDAGAAPDISTITVSHSAGVLVLHLAVTNRTALAVPDQAGVALDVDPDAFTGSPQPEFQGADVVLQLFGSGEFWIRRWNGTTFPFEPSPSDSFRASWADGYRFSIALNELGEPKKVGFVAVTQHAPAGTRVDVDRFQAVYNLETGSGEDPFVDPQVPAAPTGVRATRSLRSGVRVAWLPSNHAGTYHVWRARARSGRGTRIATTQSESFLDRRAARGVTYFYWVRALNDVGVSKPSRRVAGMRR